MIDFLSQRQAKIYSPTKTATQSGTNNTKCWLLEFEQNSNRFNEPIMGWVASQDTMQQLRLSFDSLDAAVNYAQNNYIDYRVIMPKERKTDTKSCRDIL